MKNNTRSEIKTNGLIKCTQLEIKKKKKCLNSYGSKSSSGLLEMEKEYAGQLGPRNL